MKNIQLAINGIAENKEFNDELGLKTQVIVRPKLADYISSKLDTNKIGFARMLKISPAAVSKWLNTYTEPSMDMIKRIGRYCGLSVAEVIDLFEIVE